MLSKEHFTVIAGMQDAMNILAAGEDWKQKKLAWDTALFREGGEAIDHFGWEWWKTTKSDIPQTKMEVVDMLHFAVSGAIETHSSNVIYDAIIQNLSEMPIEVKAQIAGLGFTDLIKQIAIAGIEGNFSFAIYLIVESWRQLGFSEEELYTAYVGKNVLNRFRKMNGYKEGTYIKIWNGREDNEHLSEIIAATDVNHPDFINELMSKLQAIYTVIQSQQPTN